MQLPKYKKKKRVKLKNCQEPGCGAEYWGHPISKYCELHRDIKNRQKKRKRYIPDLTINMIFNHEFKEPTKVEFECHAPGCKVKYWIRAEPKLYVYPKYCEEHRNRYKRELFMRKTGKDLSLLERIVEY